jgi:hypothetical protein
MEGSERARISELDGHFTEDLQRLENQALKAIS